MDIIALDKSVTLALNSLHCPFSDSMWMLFSDREIWFVMYFIVAVFLFLRLGWKRALVVAASIALTVTCCDQLANFTKEYFARLRPCEDPEMIERGIRCIVGRYDLYGFYSAHAANAICFSVSSLLGFRLNDRNRKYLIYGWAIVVWGLMVGFSRVFVGKHFLGDVLTGFAVGVLFAFIFSYLAAWINRKYLTD